MLTSAAYDERADDAAPFTPDRADDGGHSPFAWALLEGLLGKADYVRVGSEPDGVITATELYQYIREEGAVNDRQTPGIFPLKRENKGEFVFLAPGAALNLEPDPPLDDANNPWLGLEAYSRGEKNLFFGRRAATEELLARVEAGRFVAVVGASGSEKSSLARPAPTDSAGAGRPFSREPPPQPGSCSGLASSPPFVRKSGGVCCSANRSKGRHSGGREDRLCARYRHQRIRRRHAESGQRRGTTPRLSPITSSNGPTDRMTRRQTTRLR